MKTRYIILFLTLYINSLSAQDAIYKNFEWDKKPTYEFNKENDKEILKRHEIIEFVTEENGYVEYYLKHQAEFINSHNEIEKNNKKYIPFSMGGDVIVHKARVIAPNNSIIELDESKFIESIDEESGVKHKYFAFEGIEQGSIIEYYYVIKKRPSYSGRLSYFQFDFPLQQYKFELYAPLVHLYDFNIKNHDDEVQRDTTITTKNHWVIDVKDVPKLVEEEYSPYNSLRKHLVYKLDHNFATSDNDVTSYGTVTQNVYANVYSIDNKEQKIVDKIAASLKEKATTSEEPLIREIENYCKTNFRIAENSSWELSNIEKIEEGKIASKFGILRLICSLLKTKGIEHEIILTSDRMNNLFDPEFESYHSLGEYFIYFKQIDKYLNPNDNAYRLGFIPFQYTDNYGLFIRGININNLSTGLGEVKYINPTPHSSSVRNISVSAELNTDELSTQIKMKTVSSGYNALYMQFALEMLPEDKRKELVTENFKGLLKDIQIDKWSVKNDKADLFAVEPAIMSCEGTSASLLQRAGNKLLFKLGELIGPQMEMYNDTARKLPMHAFYKRMYEHELKIKIPKGYKVKNLDAIKIDKKHTVDNNVLMQFVSDYTLKGDDLIVRIDEFYKQISFTTKEVSNYREVVNGASDFNKVVLVLEKIE